MIERFGPVASERKFDHECTNEIASSFPPRNDVLSIFFNSKFKNR
jgi:hypothetical protein